MYMYFQIVELEIVVGGNIRHTKSGMQSVRSLVLSFRLVGIVIAELNGKIVTKEKRFGDRTWNWLSKKFVSVPIDEFLCRARRYRIPKL